MTSRIQSMMIGLQPEQRPACSAATFVGHLRRLASAGMNVFEQAALGEFVDTVAERPAWVNVLTIINEILTLVLDCVSSYGKEAAAEGRPSLQPIRLLRYPRASLGILRDCHVVRVQALEDAV